MKPMQIIDYGIGRGIGGGIGAMTGRGVRGMWRVAKKPGVAKLAGAAGVGMLTEKELAKRRRRKIKPMYAMPNDYWDLPPTGATQAKRAASKVGTASKIVGKRVGRAAVRGAKGLLIGLAAKEVLDLISKRRPFMPEIRSDIELSGYKTLDQVVQYAGEVPTPMLKMLKSKSGTALKGAKKGVERGLLLWLMGFISAELLSRGITSPKKRHEVTLPPQGYAQNTPKGFQPYHPRNSTTADMGPMPKWKGKWKSGKWVKRGKQSLLPMLALAGGAAAKHIVTRRQKKTWKEKIKKKLGYMHDAKAQREKYNLVEPGWNKYLFATKNGRAYVQSLLDEEIDTHSFGSAARKIGHAVKRVGSVTGKALGTATNIAIPVMIGAEVLNAVKRKKRPVVPPVPKRSLTVSSYGIITRWQNSRQRRQLRKDISGLEAHLKQRDDQAVSRMLMSRFIGDPPHPYKEPKYGPRNADLLAQLNAKNRQLEKISTHSIGSAVKHIRSIRHLGKSRVLGKDLVSWTNKLSARLKAIAHATKSPETKKQLLKRADAWSTASGQTQELMAKQHLDKLGMAAVGIAGGVAAHETGKQRERARVRKVVG